MKNERTKAMPRMRARQNMTETERMRQEEPFRQRMIPGGPAILPDEAHKELGPYLSGFPFPGSVEGLD